MKKRRRPEDEAAHSKKKKVELSEQRPAVAPAFQVTKIQKPQVSPPVVGEALSGPPHIFFLEEALTQNLALTPGISLPNSFPFDAYEKNERPTAKRRKSGGLPPPSEMALHSSAHRTVNYTAREERSKSVDTVLNHFLAVIDPRTGEVEVIQAKKMVVRGTVRSKQAPSEAMQVSSAKPVWLKLCDILAMC